MRSCNKVERRFLITCGFISGIDIVPMMLLIELSEAFATLLISTAIGMMNIVC